MLVVAVKFKVEPGFAEAFRELILRQAANSLEKEPGCKQFDVAFAEDDPSSCLLFEVYDDAAAFDVHVTTDHFAQFSTAIEGHVLSKEASRWTLATSA